MTKATPPASIIESIERSFSSKPQCTTGDSVKKLLIISALLLSACTTIQVKELDRKANRVDLICIENNPRVVVSDFVSVLEMELQARQIKTKVFSTERPKDCEYILTYVATRGWDLSPFLNDADIRISKNDLLVASAHYHVISGLNLTKYQGTQTKMAPVFKKLFGETQKP